MRNMRTWEWQKNIYMYIYINTHLGNISNVPESARRKQTKSKLCDLLLINIQCVSLWWAFARMVSKFFFWYNSSVLFSISLFFASIKKRSTGSQFNSNTQFLLFPALLLLIHELTGITLCLLIILIHIRRAMWHVNIHIGRIHQNAT